MVLASSSTGVKFDTVPDALQLMQSAEAIQMASGYKQQKSKLILSFQCTVTNECIIVFVMAGINDDPLTKEPNAARLLLEKLKPEDGDAIIIGSDMEDERRAELAAKNAALTTIMAHESHHLI